MKKICVVTSTRAEYGIMKPLIEKINNHRDLELNLVVTGTHLYSEFGNTVDEIIKDGFAIYEKVKIPMKSDSKKDMICNVGEAVIAFADFFDEYTPDLLVILGDRFEIFAVATAAAMYGIKIAHLHGGETTQGAVDEFFRHSVTKMAHLHFTANSMYANRVIQLGENPDSVFSYGALSVENSLNLPLITTGELSNSLNFSVSDKKYFVVTFHPVTMENDSEETQLMSLVSALDMFSEYKFIITKSNADAGGNKINALWDKLAQNNPNWIVVESLGVLRYLSALKYCLAIIGNSSSGIIEGPAMKVPTINIGNRQKGRMTCESIISCECEENAIIDAIKKSITKEFQEIAKNVVNPFGGQNISDKMIESIIKYLSCSDNTSQKTFYDLGENII